ncbi:MAG TPA: LiaF domain-containing protein [Chitinophagaceae bacterium]|nr:LiaF domain-containing protein [Chitinophagaceae bacterium]
MEDFRERNKEYQRECRTRWEIKMEEHDRKGQLWMGLFVVAVGVVALLRSMKVEMPAWVYTWQMLLIAFGLFMGLRHWLRPGGWMLPVIIGGFFLADQYFYYGQLRQYIWPMAIILLGFLFMIKSRKRRYYSHRIRKKKVVEAFENADKFTEDYFKDRKKYKVDIFSCFSNTKKKVTAGNFKGGDVTSFFGGTELNLLQADFDGKARLDVTAIFGGAKLIIPANWAVKSDVTSFFGGIEDKRPASVQTPDKILVLDGFVFFGGIEINNY